MKPGDATPRGLSASDNSIGNGVSFVHMSRSSYVPTNDNMSISSYYFQDRKNFRCGLHGWNARSIVFQELSPDGYDIRHFVVILRQQGARREVHIKSTPLTFRPCISAMQTWLLRWSDPT